MAVATRVRTALSNVHNTTLYYTAFSERAVVRTIRANLRIRSNEAIRMVMLGHGRAVQCGAVRPFNRPALNVTTSKCGWGVGEGLQTHVHDDCVTAPGRCPLPPTPTFLCSHTSGSRKHLAKCTAAALLLETKSKANE